MITKCELIDRYGNSLKKYPFGLIKLLDEGNILGRSDSFLIKLDPDLNVIWKIPFHFQIHHEITVDDRGNIYLFTPDIHEFMGLNVRFDAINIFSPDGKLIYKWCVYDHLKEFVSIISKSAWLRHLPVSYEQSKSLEEYIKQDPERFIVPTDADCDCNFEFTHFNSLQVLPENKISDKIHAFKKDNLLLSFHPYSSYGILNISSGKIEWVGYLPERTRLHAPHLTSANTILVFQNCTSTDWTPHGDDDSLHAIFSQKIPHQMQSRNPESRLWTSITEYDPLTNNKIWEYTAEPKESLCASSRGSAQRLPNGNTLVCATTKSKGGRIFELTYDKKIVWDYSYPANELHDTVPVNFYRAKWFAFEFAEKFIHDIKH